jgi:hypothetical protein
MTNLFAPLPRPVLSSTSTAHLQASGHNPAIPGSDSSYEITARYSLPDHTAYYYHTLVPRNLDSQDTLMFIFKMSRECTAGLWRQYMATRRQQISAAIGLEMNVPEGIDWELFVDDVLVDGERRSSKLMKWLEMREKVWGLNECILGS